MDSAENPSNTELRKTTIRYIGFTLASLLIIFLLVAFIAAQYQMEAQTGVMWIYENIGLSGLLGILFLSDCFLSPFPPDILLYVVSQSPLQEDWASIVGIMGLISVIAGMSSVLIAERLSSWPPLKKILGMGKKSYHEQIKRFGAVAVALGALTPLPYSLICWLAGFYKVPKMAVFIACLFRIPRYLLYYWVIAAAGH